ncbi:glycerophosphodiester phosphodiesterase [Stackebrandtia albiflava]
MAHRAGCGDAPEMTAAAFAAAAAHRPTTIEVDVQLTRDGVPVLLHDFTPARTTDVAAVFPGRADHPVNTFTLSELHRLDAGAHRNGRFAGQRILTLAEVPDLIGPCRTGLFVELKHPARHPGLERAVDDVLSSDSRWDDLIAADRLTFLSFAADSLRRMSALRPGVASMWLATRIPGRSRLARLAGWADEFGVDERAVSGPDDVARVQAAGLRLNVYTVNDPDRMRELLDWGVDALTTDYPGVLAAVLDREPAGVN